MPAKKRLFETNLSGAPGLELPEYAGGARPERRRDDRRREKPFPVPREIILRLIQWFEK